MHSCIAASGVAHPDLSVENGTPKVPVREVGVPGRRLTAYACLCSHGSKSLKATSLETIGVEGPSDFVHIEGPKQMSLS